MGELDALKLVAFLASDAPFHQQAGDSGTWGARLGAVTHATDPAGPAARVGIEKIGVYPCSLALSLPALCKARQRDPADICVPMMLEERSLSPVWEDPVTMAVNAANAILTDDDRRRIELLIVASESGVDYEKPISTWVQRFAGLSQNCRNFEVKHACYVGTAAPQIAASWLAAGAPEDAKALSVPTVRAAAFRQALNSVSVPLPAASRLTSSGCSRSRSAGAVYRTPDLDRQRPPPRGTGNSEPASSRISRHWKARSSTCESSA